eukprot:scaffold125846_cov15-Prasinocladus_malaysianus.AAC.1
MSNQRASGKRNDGSCKLESKIALEPLRPLEEFGIGKHPRCIVTAKPATAPSPTSSGERSTRTAETR